MKDCEPVRTAVREARRRTRLGEQPHLCILCGETDPVTLIAKTREWLATRGVPASVFEAHHVSGEAHDPDFTFPICRNCHAKAHEGLLQAGITLRPAASPWIRDALRLEAIAMFFEMLASACRRWASEIRNRKVTP